MPLTEKEMEIMKALADLGSYEKTAEATRLAPGTIRAITFRIRLKYDKALEIVTTVRKYQQQLSKKSRKKRYFTG
jgi:hypothetical protein